MAAITYRFSRKPYLLAPFRARHYRAAAGIVRVVRRPWWFVYRYATGRGNYPVDVRVSTPAGTITLRAFTAHDMQTINEIFCRHDYRVPDDVRTVVDVGSNIGISAAYFLTRNGQCRVHCFEPVPSNVERLQHNLGQFEGRWTLAEVAVGPEAGRVSFGLEPTGRYGGLLAPKDWPQIEVECRAIDDALSAVLLEAGKIDLLKIDTEGLELDTVNAIDPATAKKVKEIVFESAEPQAVRDDVYEARWNGIVNRVMPRLP